MDHPFPKIIFEKKYQGLWLDHCDSTNQVAREWAEQGALQGSWVVARTQSLGRGRLGRQWISRPGNLFFSMVVRFEPLSLWSWLPLLASISLIEAIKTSGWSSPLLQIKWPNDLGWLDASGEFHKVAGILCESQTGKNASVIIGIGVNCENAPAAYEIEQRKAAYLQGVSRERLAENLVSTLQKDLESFSEGMELELLKEKYSQFSLLKPGQLIEWEDVHHQGQAGFVIGLGLSGQLRVKTLNGEVDLVSEEVRVFPKAFDESQLE